MNKIVTLLISVFLLSSCSTTYYISKLDSPDLIKNPQTGALTFENDSIKITYNFFGENAPVHVDIYNKLKVPMYIDWQRSALIIGETAVSYMGNKLKFNGSMSSSSWGADNYSYWKERWTNGSFSGSATIPEGLAFIPPHAKVERTQLRLDKIVYKNIQESQYETEKLGMPDGSLKKIKVSKFTNGNSPLSFRSYLTVYTLEEGMNKPKLMTYEQSFFVEEVSKLRLNPKNLLSYEHQSGDTFYNKEYKGKGWGTVGLVAGTVAVAGISATLDTNE